MHDVWETLDLKKLGIPNGSNHNHNYRFKVTFTTRLRDVCETLEAQKTIQMWNLLIWRRGMDSFWLLHIEKDVGKECKGLLLAIITVAGALRRKSKPSWEDALVQLQRSAPVNIPGGTKTVYQTLKLSYDHLESNEIRLGKWWNQVPFFALFLVISFLAIAGFQWKLYQNAWCDLSSHWYINCGWGQACLYGKSRCELKRVPKNNFLRTI